MVYDDKKQKKILEDLDSLIQRQKEMTYIDPTKADDLDTLGVLVAKKSEWSSEDILKVICSALEDANFEDLRDKIKDIDKYSKYLCNDCVGDFAVETKLVENLKHCPYCGLDKFQEDESIKIGGEENANKI